MSRDKYGLIKGKELEKADGREAAGMGFKLQWKNGYYFTKKSGCIFVFRTKG